MFFLGLLVGFVAGAVVAVVAVAVLFSSRPLF